MFQNPFSLLLNAFTVYTYIWMLCSPLFVSIVYSVYILICCVYDQKTLFDFEHRLNGLGASVRFLSQGFLIFGFVFTVLRTKNVLAF